MKKYRLTIEGDTNDGDYSTEITDITEEEYSYLKPYLEDVRKVRKWSSKWTDHTLIDLYPHWYEKEILEGEWQEYKEEYLKDKENYEWGDSEWLLDVTNYFPDGVHTITKMNVTLIPNLVKKYI